MRECPECHETGGKHTGLCPTPVIANLRARIAELEESNERLRQQYRVSQALQLDIEHRLHSAVIALCRNSTRYIRDWALETLELDGPPAPMDNPDTPEGGS